MKKWIIAGLLCVVVGGVAVAFTRTDSGDGDQGPKTVTVELGTLVDKALVTGEIMPRHEVDVKSKISGTVARIFVQEGRTGQHGRSGAGGATKSHTAGICAEEAHTGNAGAGGETAGGGSGSGEGTAGPGDGFAGRF